MKLIGILILLSINLYAAGACIELEGINIGCVSSVDHGCFMNKAVNKNNDPCHYVGSPNTMYRVAGPIAWSCKSSKNTTVCSEDKGNGDKSGTTCVTSSECVEYFQPSCSEQCVPCFDNVVTENTGTSKGCIICNRKPCADELPRLTKTTCPHRNSTGMPLGSGDKCSSDTRCPKTAIPPNGGAPMDVIIRKGQCSPPKLPDPPIRPEPLLCTWKVDKRSATGCEPIEPDNRNP